MLASCGSEIKYLEWPTCKVKNVFKNAGSMSSNCFRCISWSGSGKKVATIPDGHFAIVINPSEFDEFSGMQFQEIQVPRVNTLSFSKKYEDLVALGCESGHVFQYDTKEKGIHVVASLPNPVNIVKYGIGDEALAASCKGGQIYVFNKNEKLMSTYFVPNSWTVSAMALHPNERNVLCGASKEGIVAVWDTASGNLKYQAHDHQSEITDLSFSPCDWLFASTSLDYTLNMYDLRIKERIFYKMFPQKLSAIAFPNHGNQFVVGSQHGKVMTFDKRKMSIPKIISQVHDGAVRQLAFQYENFSDDHTAETVKICQSEISLKNESNSDLLPVESKVGSGDAGDIIEITKLPMSIDSDTSKCHSQMDSWLAKDSCNNCTFQAMLGAQEEICRCTEETLKSFVREMHDKFLMLWMSINKNLASLENKNEMNWRKFHTMIFDLGSQESSGDAGFTSITSQTSATNENPTSEITDEDTKKPVALSSRSVSKTGKEIHQQPQQQKCFKVF